MNEQDSSFVYISKVLSAGDSFGLALFPAGTKNTASSRLRFFSVVECLGRERIAPIPLHCGLEIPGIEVAWFQKKLSTIHLDIARKLKRRGVAVVYDCDESGSALTWWAQPELAFQMFHMADWIVADTPERLRWIKQSFTTANLRVLENQIDYADPDFKRWPVVIRTQPMPLRVMWFGNSGNLASLRDFFAPFRESNEYRLVICGATQEETASYLHGCQVELHPWTKDGFPELLRSCDVTLLSHHGSKSDAMKSGHKMITSIYHGVPAIVSRTPDYSRIAAYAGVEDFVFSDACELSRILQNCRKSETRRQYIDRAQPRLMAKYFPGSFAQAALGLANEAKSKKCGEMRCLRALSKLLALNLPATLYTSIGKLYWRRMQNLVTCLCWHAIGFLAINRV